MAVVTMDQADLGAAAPSPGLNPSPPAGAPPRRRRFRWGRFGIQSKLLIMLCLTSVVSSVVVGMVAYRAGTDSLRNAAYQRLESMRNLRATEITRTFDTLHKDMNLYTLGATLNQATEGFIKGFQDLKGATVTPAQDAAVDKYYDDVFVPALNKNMGTSSTEAGFVPTSPAQKYLQAHYTAPFTDFDAAIKLDDAGDGSAWSATHAQFQAYFRGLTTGFNYDDAAIMDLSGNVVYTAYAGVDLGTNLESGPYRESNLAQAYQAALASNDLNYVGLTDLGRYQPSDDIPTGWVVSPVGQNGKIIGVLALALPLSTFNDVMTGDGNWVADGFGQTGETFLAGPDRMMRSTSRLVQQDPEQYKELAIAAGLPVDVATKAAAVKGTVLLQTLPSGAVGLALQGQTGTTVETNYLGRESLIAYAPLKIEGLQWVVIAQVQADEVFAPITALTRNIVLATLAIIFLVSIAALFLAQVFARPVRRLAVGVREVTAGKLGTQVQGTFSGEFGDLAAAFNDMSRSLFVKQQLLDEQLAENDRLLLTIMPETVAERYRQGEETIAQDHKDVSVVFAELVGFEDLSRGTSSEQSVALFNEMIRSFDDAAGRLGIEKVRTMRNGYLASCGLTVPRVDHVRRIVDFAVEMQRIVDRFNAQHATTVRLRAGIDTGTVSSGLLGRTSLVYDLWGDAVNLAYKVRELGGSPGIFLTDEVARRVGTSFPLAEAGQFDTVNGPQPIWALAVTD